MASTKHPGRSALVLLLVILILLGGGIAAAVKWGTWQATPKLALDLEGGTQVILSASTPDGSPVKQDQLNRAIQIMGQRVNGLGVAETQITAQGGNNIVVDIPGSLDQQTADALRRTALMEFRPVLLVGPPQAEGQGKADQAGDKAKERDPNAGAPGADKKLPPTSTEWLTPAIRHEFNQLNCTDPKVLGTPRDKDPNKPLVTCAEDGHEKYVLGPAAVRGDEITSATVSNETTGGGQITNFYQVNLSFNPTGAKAFGDITTTLFNSQGDNRRFGIVLDGFVVSAPAVDQGPLTGGTASIHGSMTQKQAELLANQLRFGALPLKFQVQSEQQISATLGTDQLEKGLIAGAIGMLLVMAYSVLQYRALSMVTIASLVAASALTYGVITVMSNLPDIGFRLSLAGVAGLIVAIGFTADSFIVYFERVRDELRDGRGLSSAVEHGWRRARRTILASDAVNFIAAAVLYVLSVGSVRGFAFTLGLTTLIDLVVVFLFTHPMLQVLARTRFFGHGHRFSGLDPRQLGRSAPIYAGRGRIRGAEERGESLAERKARLAREQAKRDQNSSGGSDKHRGSVDHSATGDNTGGDHYGDR
ncbi:protein translocase subunit SecD [Devriesea agamarum]|uniref:protein translocase subunit SecD n=1 Tax=Devriesea agamarum TaxID=472569 RepID=UPI000A071CA8|nr:protein translocase subunit SecD [Devriesea agamarum]